MSTITFPSGKYYIGSPDSVAGDYDNLDKLCNKDYGIHEVDGKLYGFWEADHGDCMVAAYLTPSNTKQWLHIDCSNDVGAVAILPYELCVFDDDLDMDQLLFVDFEEPFSVVVQDAVLDFGGKVRVDLNEFKGVNWQLMVTFQKLIDVLM